MKAVRKIWSVGWRVAVGLLLLGWIFHSIFLNEGRVAWSHGTPSWESLSRLEQWRAGWAYGPPELWRTLSQTTPSAFAFSVLLMGLTILFGVLRWRMVLRVQGLELPAGRALSISFVAHFFNSLLLGSTGGDLIKAFYAARETHHKKTEAVVTVFVDRLVGLWAMLLFAGLWMVPNQRLLFSTGPLASISLLILGMLAGCSVVLGVAFWGGISQHWPQARAFLRRIPKGELLERSLTACRQFGRQRRFLLKTLVVSMGLNTICVLQVTTLASSLGMKVEPMAFFAIVPMIICVSALPITPSGLGVRENLFVLTLSAPVLAVPQTSALSLSLLAYAGSLFWSLVGGMVYLFLRKREHLEEVTEAPEEALEADGDAS